MYTGSIWDVAGIDIYKLSWLSIKVIVFAI